MSQDTKYEIMYIIRPNIDEEAKRFSRTFRHNLKR